MAAPDIKPVENWRDVLRHAWSVRFIAVAAVLSGLEIVVQVMLAYGVKPPVPPLVFAAAAGAVTVAAFVARFVAQQKLGAK